jgi:hypothetical protein
MMAEKRCHRRRRRPVRAVQPYARALKLALLRACRRLRFNRRIGVVEGWSEAKGRYGVQLPGATQPLGIRPNNLAVELR